MGTIYRAAWDHDDNGTNEYTVWGVVATGDLQKPLMIIVFNDDGTIKSVYDVAGRRDMTVAELNAKYPTPCHMADLQAKLE